MIKSHVRGPKLHKNKKENEVRAANTGHSAFQNVHISPLAKSLNVKKLGKCFFKGWRKKLLVTLE